MFSLFSEQKTGAGSVVVVADIDSAGASVALLQVGEKGKPSRIIASHRSNLPMEDRTTEQAASLVVLALADAAHAVMKSAPKGNAAAAPSVFHVVVRGPWTSTLTFEGVESFETVRKITNPYLVTFAQNILKQKGDALPEPPFEAHIATVELNGYPTRAPSGKSAHLIRATVLASSVQVEFRTAVEHALNTAFPGRSIVWCSHTRALLETLRETAVHVRNCCIVDMSGAEITMIAVRKDTMVGQAIIPEGHVSIIRKIAQDGVPEETISMIRALENETCRPEECARITASLAETEQWLVRRVGEKFAEMAQVRRLPNTLFVLAHSDISAWFARFLGRIDFAPFSVTTLPFSVVPLSTAYVQPFVVSDTPVDASLLLACALVHTERSRT